MQRLEGLVIGAVLFAAAGLGCGGGGGGGGGGGACSTATACGGDVVGTWNASPCTTDSPNAANVLSHFKPYCNTATIGTSSAMSTGSVTFASNLELHGWRGEQRLDRRPRAERLCAKRGTDLCTARRLGAGLGRHVRHPIDQLHGERLVYLLCEGTGHSRRRFGHLRDLWNVDDDVR